MKQGSGDDPLLTTLLKTNYLDLFFLKEVIEQELPFWRNLGAVQEELITEIVKSLAESKTPLDDVIDKYRENRGDKNVQTNAFTQDLLTEGLKLSNVLSLNKIYLLADIYKNFEIPIYVDIDHFR